MRPQKKFNHMKYLSLLVIACLLVACGGDSFQKELERLKRDQDIREASYQKLREQYQVRMGDYRNLLEAHNNAANETYKDSLHQAINEQHGLLEQNHLAFFKKHDELLEQHKGLKARIEVEGYDAESIKADFQQIAKDYNKMEREFEYINAELTQMIDEQQGMLSKH
jgi:hypothetical protein